MEHWESDEYVQEDAFGENPQDADFEQDSQIAHHGLFGENEQVAVGNLEDARNKAIGDYNTAELAEKSFARALTDYMEKAWISGKSLNETRVITPHGKWDAWIREARITRTTAQRYMGIAEHYTLEQLLEQGSLSKAYKAIPPKNKVSSRPSVAPEPEAHVGIDASENPAARGAVQDAEVIEVEQEPGLDPSQAVEEGTGGPVVIEDDGPGEERLTPAEQRMLESDQKNETIQDLTQKVETLQQQVGAIEDMDRPQLADGVAQIANMGQRLKIANAKIAEQLQTIQEQRKEITRLKRNLKKAWEEARGQGEVGQTEHGEAAREVSGVDG